jgi:hypothetical protein
MSRISQIAGVSAAAMVMASALLSITPAQQAHAANCYAEGCYQHSAAQEGCTADAEQIYKVSAPYSAGYIQLYYSPTCRAAWGRLQGASWEGGDSITVYNLDGENQSCDGIFVKASNTWGCNTPMVNDAGTESYAVGYFLEYINPPVHTGTY